MSNLLLKKDGVLKLADFGLARQLVARSSGNRAGDEPYTIKQLTSNVQTLWYRAPEILLDIGEQTQQCDMWSLGCIIAELLSKG